MRLYRLKEKGFSWVRYYGAHATGTSSSAIHTQVGALAACQVSFCGLFSLTWVLKEQAVLMTLAGHDCVWEGACTHVRTDCLLGCMPAEPTEDNRVLLDISGACMGQAIVTSAKILLSIANQELYS